MKNRTPEYDCWRNIKQRCYNSKFRQYADYGGRGIGVFKDWLGRGGFAKFLACVGKRPSDQYSLDRIDNNKDYEPGNVRWATWKSQNNNSRKNVFLTAKGKTQTMAQWSEETGIGESTIRSRLKMGWSEERAVTEPARPKRRN